LRLTLIIVVACLAGAGVAVLVFGTDDNDSKSADATALTTPASTAPPNITSRLQPGEVGVIVTDDSLRLTTPRAVRDRGLLSLAIDNRGTRRIEVVLARDTRPPRFLSGSSLRASTSTFNQLPVSPGRYIVIAREPTEDSDDDDDAVSGFAQASLRVR